MTVSYIILLSIPALAGLLALAMPTPKKALAAMVAGVLVTACWGFRLVLMVSAGAVDSGTPGWLFLDALSAWHLAVLLVVFILCAVYAWVYFNAELKASRLTLKQARLFSGLFTSALSTMSLALAANNLGLMWVGVEATTLVTAFLIHLHPSKESLEAMWKYILICSVGVAFAFMGTLLTAASARDLAVAEGEAMLWTTLRANAALLNPMLLKTAFIFILVGYGTKAGLSPMHNWLPDAHSQAPSPVSALFSGFMLNTALYCIMRFTPIVEIALGNSGWALGMLKGFGLFSIAVAAAFIVFQRDLKRLLAYCSVEHIGIIALGLGLGGWGVFAALFHALNHSVAKVLAFFSAGRLGQIHGTHDMRRLSGAWKSAPLWAFGLFGSLLALIGAAPFSVFMSEFLIAKAAVDARAWAALALFLAGAGVIFVAILGHAIPLFWGRPEPERAPVRATLLEGALVSLPLLILLFLGIFMPPGLKEMIVRAAAVVQGGP